MRPNEPRYTPLEDPTNAEPRPRRPNERSYLSLVSADLNGRFATPALVGAENTLGAASHAVLLTNSRGDPKLERAHIDQLAARGVDGLLVLGGETDARPPVHPGTARDIPIVYTYAPSNDPKDCSVTCDNVAAGEAAINHLLDHGRRSIAVISGPEHYQATKDRILGANRTMQAAGLRFAVPTRYGNWHESWGRTAAGLILESGVQVNAIYCLNDMLARGAIDTILSCGLDVPGDIAVLGHDNWAVTATEGPVPITSFDNNLQEIGRRSARLLLDIIRGNPHHGTLTIGCSLVVRRSTVARR
ncbi:substrate-binding domain-containing protein [Bifidobacterium pullorum subsp. saeculare]|uniref:Substrate-binding domain-containing protein n=1 Tax=Bifidobacterium pullorum subsp. saeculare TaxID=78257 RepID=A0A938X0I5_9BIFI|nr:substrate-binding domain-containing protein [Bifidobacterium pullorum subsp. saeculare]